MQIIDSHQHFWKFNPVRDSWIGDDMAVIQRDFLPVHLLEELQQNHVDGCVVVQSDQSEEENLFQLKNAAENWFVKGVVGWIDLQADNIEERLEFYSGFRLLKGFRHVLQAEPQRDLMLHAKFTRGISLLHKYNFTYDILIYPDQLPFAVKLAQQFSSQPFVLDHIAKPNIKQQQFDDWQKQVELLAKCPNVYCKISGMITEADWKTWSYEQLCPYLDAVTAAFGTGRLMFGSDWPVCLVAGTYEQVLSVVQRYFSRFSMKEQEAVFSTNAMNFYNL